MNQNTNNYLAEERIEIFSKHESYAAVSEEQRGSYQREDAALREYLEWRKQV